MFIITNRNPVEGEAGLAPLGDRPNPKGPNELRIAEAKGESGKWSLRYDTATHMYRYPK